MSPGVFVQKEASGLPGPGTIQTLIAALGSAINDISSPMSFFKEKHHERILSSLFLKRFIPSEEIEHKFLFAVIKSSSDFPEKVPFLEGFHDPWALWGVSDWDSGLGPSH